MSIVGVGWSCYFGAGFVNATYTGVDGGQNVFSHALRGSMPPTRARSLAEATTALRDAGIHCATTTVDVAACAWKRAAVHDLFPLKPAVVHYWPATLAHSLAFWAATLASDATRLRLQDPRGLLTEGIVWARPDGMHGFEAGFLRAVRQPDIAFGIQVASLDWAEPFMVANEQPLGTVQPMLTPGRVADARVDGDELRSDDELRSALLALTGRRPLQTGQSWNMTRWGAKHPAQQVLVQELAGVVRTLDRHYHGLLEQRAGLLFGRDRSLQWFADMCGELWQGATCEFIDASQLQPDDRADSVALRHALSGIRSRGVEARFVIILPLGSAQSDLGERCDRSSSSRSTGGGRCSSLETHPRGDLLLLNLVQSLFPSPSAWVFNFVLAREISQEIVVLNVAKSGRTRYTFVGGVSGTDDVRGRRGTKVALKVGARSKLLTSGWSLGPVQAVACLRGSGSVIGGYRRQEGPRRALALRYWGCEGCSRLPGNGRVTAVLFVLQPTRKQSPVLWLLDTSRPLRTPAANLFVSFPGSGQTFSRLAIEVVSGQPTADLYQYSKQWPQVSMCGCFAEVLAVRKNAACRGPPILYAHHNVDFQTAADTGSLQSLTVSLRDYKAIIKNLLRNGEVTDMNQFLITTVWEYMSLVDTFERFRGRKLMLYFEELFRDPDMAIEKLADVVGVLGRARDEGLARWRKSRLEILAAAADWCAANTHSYLDAGCGASCRNFMKSQRKGPWARWTGDAAEKQYEKLIGTEQPTMAGKSAWGAPLGEPASDDVVLDATRKFEGILCPSAESPPQHWELATSLRTRRLALKYLVRPGWGTGALSALCTPSPQKGGTSLKLAASALPL